MKARAFALPALLLASACGGASPAQPAAAPTPAMVPKQTADIGAAPTPTPTARHADESFRQRPPEPAPESPFVAPTVEHAQLRSGIPVVFAQVPSNYVAVYILAQLYLTKKDKLGWLH